MTAPNGHPAAAPAPSAATLALVADALAWPLLLLRDDASLLHANRAARQMLRRGQPLLISTQRVVAPADPRRRDAFAKAVLAVAAGGGPTLLRWAPRGGFDHFAATLTALSGVDGDQPGVLLAGGLDSARATDLRAFADAHRLTRGETRVLERLARGESSASAAAALGLAAATVRAQALSLRRKTGHASIAALLHALAELPPLALPGNEGE